MKNYTISERTAVLCDAIKNFETFKESYEKALIELYGPNLGPESYEKGEAVFQAVEDLIAKELFFSVSEHLGRTDCEGII